MRMRGGENQSNESIDASKCLANDMGRMKMGLVSEDEIAELIDKRTSVGKRGRSKYGRLVCEYAGCAAMCNVEIKDGILLEKDMRQAFALLENCSVWEKTVMQESDPLSET